MLTVKMPSTTMSYEEKAEWLELLREKLRRQHNEMGRKFRKKEISEAEWRAFLRNSFEPRSTALDWAILTHRNEKSDAVRALSDDDSKIADVKLAECFEENMSIGS